MIAHQSERQRADFWWWIAIVSTKKNLPGCVLAATVLPVREIYSNPWLRSRLFSSLSSSVQLKTLPFSGIGLKLSESDAILQTLHFRSSFDWWSTNKKIKNALLGGVGRGNCTEQQSSNKIPAGADVWRWVHKLLTSLVIVASIATRTLYCWFDVHFYYPFSAVDFLFHCWECLAVSVQLWSWSIRLYILEYYTLYIRMTKNNKLKNSLWNNGELTNAIFLNTVVITYFFCLFPRLYRH